MSIEEFRQKHREVRLRKWIMRFILAESFFIALVPEIAAAALVLGVILTLVKFKIIKKTSFRPLPWDVPAVIFIVIAGISVFRSPDRAFSFYNYYHLVGAYGLTYFLIGQNVFKAHQVKKIALALSVSAGLCILYGYYQYAFGLDTMDARWVDGAVFPQVNHRVFATWENPNIFAGYLDMVIAVALGYFAYAQNKTQRAALVLIMAAAAACLMLTYARGACLTLALLVLLFGIYKDKRVALMGAVAVAVALALNPALTERLTSVLTTQDTSVEMRRAFWEATWVMIQDHPFLGIGWGAYWLVYPAYDSYMQGASIIIYHAHNMYLNYAAEIGVVGAGAFMWFFFGTMKQALETDFFLEEKNTTEKEKSDVNNIGDNTTAAKSADDAETAPQKNTGGIVVNLAAVKAAMEEKKAKPKKKHHIVKLIKITKLENTNCNNNNDKKEIMVQAEETEPEIVATQAEDNATKTKSEQAANVEISLKIDTHTEKPEEKDKENNINEPEKNVEETERRPTLSERLSVSYADLAASEDAEADTENENADNWEENIRQNLTAGEPLRWCNGLSLGIGLAFFSVALNGFTDDLLFNFPTSLLVWLLAALAAANAEIEDDPKAAKRDDFWW